MTTDFTGSDTWHAVISGPSTATPVTAASVCDMGVLEADRSMWLKNRLVGCGQILSAPFVGATTMLGSVIDLKTTTTYTTIPGMTLDLDDAVEVGDIVMVRAQMQVQYQGVAVPTNGMKLMPCVPEGGVGHANVTSAQLVISHTNDQIQPVSIGVTYKVAVAGGTGVSIKGACFTSSDNTTATVFSPWFLSAVHIRPVAAP